MKKSCFLQKMFSGLVLFCCFFAHVEGRLHKKQRSHKRLAEEIARLEREQAKLQEDHAMQIRKTHKMFRTYQELTQAIKNLRGDIILLTHYAHSPQEGKRC